MLSVALTSQSGDAVPKPLEFNALWLDRPAPRALESDDQALRKGAVGEQPGKWLDFWCPLMAVFKVSPEVPYLRTESIGNDGQVAAEID